MSLGDKDKRLVGKIVFEFTEYPDGSWYSEVKPVMLTRSVYDNYKLALIVADMQIHLKNQLGYIDRILRTKQDVESIHAELMGETTNNDDAKSKKIE